MRLTDKLLDDMIRVADLALDIKRVDPDDPTAKEWGERGRRIEQWAREQIAKRRASRGKGGE